MGLGGQGNVAAAAAAAAAANARNISGGGGGYGMTFSPMALNNLNNPYSPQPSTPVGCSEADPSAVASGMMIVGGEQQQVQQQQQHAEQLQFLRDRSRHSSAESEPAMRTNSLLSPLTGGGMGGMDGGGGNLSLMLPVGDASSSVATATRQRHASAGQVTSMGPAPAIFHTLVSPSSSWLVDDPPPVAASSSASAASAAVMVENIADASSSSSAVGRGSGAGAGGKKSEGGDLPDDLDMALSALKDCDNEFSKFVEETEDGH